MEGMNLKDIFDQSHFRSVVGIALGTTFIVLLAALTGCPAQPPPASTVVVTAPAPAAAQPAVVVQPVVVDQPMVEDTAGFIYYPNYEVYYDPVGRVYWHNDGGRWNSGPSPGTVSVDVLRASPSAHMNFHDSPENHHAQVVQQYPHDWHPSNAPADNRDRRGQ
jgi:hypothetical protein